MMTAVKPLEHLRGTVRVFLHGLYQDRGWDLANMEAVLLLNSSSSSLTSTLSLGGHQLQLQEVLPALGDHASLVRQREYFLRLNFEHIRGRPSQN